MNQQLIIFAITILLWGHVASLTCPNTMAASKTLTCSDTAADHIFDQTALQIPSGQTTLTIMFDVLFATACTSAPYDVANFYYTGSSGTQVSLASLNYDASSNLNMNFYNLNNNPYNMFAKAMNPLTGSWLSIAFMFDVGTGGVLGGAMYLPSSINSASTTTVFDMSEFTDFSESSLKLSLCAGIGGTATVACQISNLKLLYKTYTPRASLIFGQDSVQVMGFPFTEGSGYQTQNLFDTTRPSYLGASTSSSDDTTNSPAWTSGENGLTFSATTQYITIPTYTHGTIDGRAGTTSVAITFWLKLTTLPSSSNYTLFTYSAANGTAYYGTKVSTSKKLISYSQNYWSSLSTNTFTQSAWTQLTLWFSVIDSGSNTGYLYANFGGDQAFAGASLTSPRSKLKSYDFNPATDIVKIGGFIGQIADLRIYSPSSMIINNPSCSSSCSYDLGNSNPPLCLQPQCGTGSFATSSCYTCSAPCATCVSDGVCATCVAGSTLVNGACVAASCPSGQYADSNGDCQSCTNNCKTCSSATICLSCTAEFSLSSQTCTSCTAGKYALTDTSSTCTGDCPSHCDVCTGSSTCETCSSGYYKDSNGVCQSCTNNCKTCSSATTCLSCPAEFSLNSQTCTSCTTGKYALTDTSSTCTGDCPSHCDVCASSSACETCSSGYYKDNNGVCQSCTNNCKTCSSATICLSCPAEFSLSSQACTSCTAGKYALTDTSSTCTGDCPSHCDVCTGSSTCETCSSGYYKDNNGVCQSCTNNCKTCSSATICLSCPPEFSLNSQTCTSCTATKYALTDTSSTCDGTCASNCDVCTGSSASLCETCSSGYHKEGSNCVQDAVCPGGSPCLTCTSTGTCATCPLGVLPVNGFCCPAGEYPDNSGVCQSCTNNCKTCSSSTTCLSCTAKFSLNSQSCTSCTAGKYALTDTSSTCDGNCPDHCDVCTSSSTCDTCSSGYSNDGSSCTSNIVESKTDGSLSSAAVVGIAIGSSVFGVSMVGVLMYFRHSVLRSILRFFRAGRPQPKPVRLSAQFTNIKTSPANISDI